MSHMIAIHVLPSGPVPWRDNLLAISALRFEQRRVISRFSTLVRPARAPARYALEALGRSPSEFDAAPTFAQVESDLRLFLRSATLVGFNIRITLEFLAAELSRINAPGLDNDYRELADLAHERGLSVRKPGLNTIAAPLGLNPVTPGEPDAAARLTAQIAARLLEMAPLPRPEAEETGTTSLPDRWALLDPARVRSVAETPGVYVFRDKAGEVLYAGASGNLRRRLASYQSRPLELERRLEGLAERVWEIEAHPTAGYLEALLDEARMIDTHAPAFNVQRQIRQPRRFLRASTGQRPGIRPVDGVLSDGATYLGPFASARAASQALALARSVYPELGRARASAAEGAVRRRRLGSAERERERTVRAQAVREALVLLSGQRDPALRLVREHAIQAANARNYPEAERLRRLSAAIVRFELSPSPLRDGPRSRFAVAILDSDAQPRLVYHLAAGRILERRELVDAIDIDEIIAAWRAEAPRLTPNPEAFALIMRWLSLQGKRCSVTLLPPCEIESSD